MSLYSAIMRNSVFPLLLLREHRHAALRHWRSFEKSQYWSKQKLLDYQWGKLQSLLRHAYEKSAYYNRIFRERGLTPESIRNFDDLALLPMLSRDDIYDHRMAILSKGYAVADVQEVVSGGTTGQQAILYRDYNSFNIKMGLAWRHEGWMGRRPCDKMAFFWPAHGDFFDLTKSWKARLKIRHILRESYYYAGSADPQRLKAFYEDLAAFRPEYLKVFPNPLAEFTKFVIENRLIMPPMKGIMSTGELLSDNQREIFERTYGCQIFDMYGSREVGNNSSECAAHEGLHIAMETSLVEFVKEGKKVAAGQEGEILITDLTNYAFPMIRYRINDYGIYLDHNCSCGRELPLMSAGVGRLQDYVYSPDGTRHSGLMLAVHTVSDHHIHIGQIQVIQKTLTDFQVKITRRPEPTPEVFNYIEAQMKKLLGASIRVMIEVVDELPREKSGKVRFVICEVPPPATKAGRD